MSATASTVTDANRLRVVRAYTRTIGMYATEAVGDSWLMFADAGLRISRVLVLLAIWRTLVDPGEVVGGFTLPALLTYTLVAEMFAQQLQAKSALDFWLWEGTIASRLLHPMSLVGQLVAQLLGSWLFGICAVTLPILALSPLLGVDPAPASWLGGVAFVPSLVLSVAIALAMDVILGAVTVAYGLNTWLVGMLRTALFGLLAGAVLPLAILPWGWGKVFDWLPFASMVSAPLRIYTGTGDPLLLMPVQAGWVLVLWLVAGRVWWRNRERLVGYGG
ncbi:ABC-2 family transporter protein [Actinopolymorpha sp. B11F2]|uniref:ABC-2 family transporter protein n=1 Tax=Actinopolymorpha sp. B11F2 TaxID=3160862 RepID=UPI0032E3A509